MHMGQTINDLGGWGKSGEKKLKSYLRGEKQLNLTTLKKTHPSALKSLITKLLPVGKKKTLHKFSARAPPPPDH